MPGSGPALVPASSADLVVTPGARPVRRAAPEVAGVPGRPAGVRLFGITFDRNELAGAFGDIGTDLPLLVGVILAAGLDCTSALVAFGMLQILTGLRYRMPMPVQPLKAMAALVIAQGIGGEVLAGAGLAIGVVMLALSAGGAVDWIGRVVPKAVVRGLQVGLGLQLGLLALGRYVPAAGVPGYGLALVSLTLVFLLAGNRRYPAAIPIIVLGMAYAATTTLDPGVVWGGAGLSLPRVQAPGWHAIATGFVLLAIPQLPLSLGNSLLATEQIARDYFPDRAPSLRGIGFTYSAMNLVNPFLGGVPTCHGSGGMAGHYAFGARTGGSVILYGGFYLLLGLFFGGSFQEVIKVFPLPVLGVLLLVEGVALIRLARDVVGRPGDLAIVLGVGLMAVSLPYGYGVAMVAGSVCAWLLTRKPRRA